ncbi:MAG: HNH endonuclease signature motif containing protein, partial [Dehalococcoidia bacterium]|nr:HNH endonuclease signature motif containing protein [Dehalococcoidia bacterium]
HMDTRCWVWTGAKAEGYGVIRDGKRQTSTHRVVYALTHGKIPRGAQVTHDCDNRACCRPDHIRLGTPLSNAREAAARGRLLVGEASSRAVPYERRVRGERVNTARLTTDKVRAIRVAVSAGATYRALAVEHDVSWNAIRLIALRKNWKHVADEVSP